MVPAKTVVLIIFLSAFLSLATQVFATQTTYTFYATADSYIKDNGQNENEGLATNLRLQQPDRSSHVLVKFSQTDILAAIGTNHVIAANLKLYIETNFNNWGSGAPIDVHRISTDWEERITTNPAQGVTYKCGPVDSNLSNSIPDCEEEWAGGFYDNYISASLLHQNNQTGWKTYSVTPDVQILQNEYDHFGWLIRKRDPAANGSLDYTSIQGTASFKPRLEVTVDDQSSCTPTVIETITPAIIPSDGGTYTITVTGSGLDRVTALLVDKNPNSYTLVSSTTITFTQSYSSVGEHQISFQSNCLTDPFEDFTILADTAMHQLHGLQGGGVNCNTPAVYTNFSRDTTGDFLCWRGTPVRLIGYSGQYTRYTWDTWTNSATQTYFRKAQLKEGTPDGTNRRGFNFVRISAMGGSCNEVGGAPGTCTGYENQKETMPFNWTSSTKYKMLTAADFNQLSSTWRNRIKNTIKHANNNGVAVMIHLFDENVSKGAAWGNNPWNMAWNNLVSTCDLPPSGDSLPKFYQDGGATKCLRKAQKNYVRAVASFLRSTQLKICQPNGNSHCRDIIIEVMNEARLHTGWTGFNKTNFKNWHLLVEKWINSGAVSGYMISASVKGNDDIDECTPNSNDDVCMINVCNAAGCPNHNGHENFFEAFTANSTAARNEIDIVSLHYDSWGAKDSTQEDVNLCDYDNQALKLEKPVIFDDDGGEETDPNEGRNDNCNIENWSQSVGTNCGISGNFGKLHYYHTGDGSVDQGNQPSACLFLETTTQQNIDCQAWNGLADGLPTKLCLTGMCTGAWSRINYCENGPNQCKWNSCDILE